MRNEGILSSSHIKWCYITPVFLVSSGFWIEFQLEHDGEDFALEAGYVEIFKVELKLKSVWSQQLATKCPTGPSGQDILRNKQSHNQRSRDHFVSQHYTCWERVQESSHKRMKSAQATMYLGASVQFECTRAILSTLRWYLSASEGFKGKLYKKH